MLADRMRMNRPTAGDPYWSSVAALLHLEGSSGSTTITDHVTKIWSVHGDAKLSTAAAKFGSSSLILGGSGDSIYTADSTVVDITTGDFTVEMWVYRAASGVQHYLVSKRVSGEEASGYEWRISSSNNLQFFHVGGLLIVSALTVPSGEWVHLALSKASGTVRQFVNGVLDANSGSFGSATANTSHFIIGTSEDWSGGFNGYIDEFRLTKGVCRYSASFTPPATQFPNS